MLAIFGQSMAGTINPTATMTVNATVAANCTITVTPIVFGSYDPIGTNSATGVDLQSPGTVQIKCLKSSTPTVTLGTGANFSGTRRLKDTSSGDFLPYEIYQPSAATPNAGCTYSGTKWGDSAGTYGTTFSPSATWAASTLFTFNVCGVIPKGSNPSIGAGYQDTVVATVTF